MKKIEYIKKQDAIDAIVASNRNVDVDGLCFSRYVVCGSLTPRRNPTDFCSYGERKEPNV